MTVSFWLASTVITTLILLVMVGIDKLDVKYCKHSHADLIEGCWGVDFVFWCWSILELYMHMFG